MSGDKKMSGDKPIISFEVDGKRITSEQLQNEINKFGYWFNIISILGIIISIGITVWFFTN